MMTNAGMFEEIKKVKHIERLKNKIKKLESEIHRLTTLEIEHKKINGEMNVEIEKLKKDNDLLKEGNEALGIYRQEIDPAPAIQKLIEKQTRMANAGLSLVKKHKKNWLLKFSVENLIKITFDLKKIHNKLTKKN